MNGLSIAKKVSPFLVFSVSWCQLLADCTVALMLQCCISLSSVIVCLSSVRNVLWINGAS